MDLWNIVDGGEGAATLLRRDVWLVLGLGPGWIFVIQLGFTRSDLPLPSRGLSKVIWMDSKEKVHNNMS